MDFIPVSLHSIVLFLLTVFFFPFFSAPFLSRLMQPNWNDIMPRGKSGWIRTHKALQENQGPTGGGVSPEVFIREENVIRLSERVIPGTDEALFVKCCNNTWTENVENVVSVLTRWWGDKEDTQMGWEGFDEKGLGEEAINISGWKKKGT